MGEIDDWIADSFEQGPELRFVVLHHTGVEVPHFDLMFERRAARGLLAFRLPAWPVTKELEIEPLARHRQEYLTYEGPVSNNRGEVKRVARGTYRARRVGVDQIVVLMSAYPGEPSAGGHLTLVYMPDRAAGDRAGPDLIVSDRTTSDRAAAHQTESDRTTLDRFASDRTLPDSTTPDRTASGPTRPNRTILRPFGGERSQP